MDIELLKKLKEYMALHSCDACIITISDPHLSEYIPDYWRYLFALSSFSGSAGVLLVMNSAMFLWTDSRYYLQAEMECGSYGITIMREGEPNTPLITDFVLNNLEEGQQVLMDPQLVSIAKYEEFSNKFSGVGIKICAIVNYYNDIWANRPELTNNPLIVRSLEYSGISTNSKLANLRNELTKKQVDGLVLTQLDEIAWVLNMRGSDISYNPVFLSYLLVFQREILLFIDHIKIDDFTQKYLAEIGVKLMPYTSFYSYISTIQNLTLILDKDRQSYGLYLYLKDNNKIFLAPSVVFAQKAIKNKIEIFNQVEVMRQDGQALVELLCWLENCFCKGQKITELDVMQKSLEFRSRNPLFYSESFACISAFASNAAIVHYHATESTNKQILTKGLYLLDSGGQYLNGTTDITRTICFGESNKEESRAYTLVLKGHIALARIIFPIGTKGRQLDALARQYLWQNGLDYGHGTGHGIGAFLNVHEGPQSIRPDLNNTELKEGMMISNEPGYYKEGEFGIRIENIVLVEKSAYDGFLCLQTISLCPIDLSVVDMKLLTEDEKVWINNYHQKVYDELQDGLSEECKAYLKEKCKLI